MACAAHSRRTAQTRNQGLGTDGFPQLANRSAPTFTELEDLPAEHIGAIVATDFFTVPTVKLRVLFVFIVLAHQRKKVLHFGVTENPTAEWVAQQMVEAFTERDTPRYLLAFLGGWIEQFGAITQTPRAVNIGVIASVLMPSEALWRRAAFEMQSPLANATRISPFSTPSVPSMIMVFYAALYLAVALGITIRRFSQQDL